MRPEMGRLSGTLRRRIRRGLPQPALPLRLGRKMIEHLLHALVEILDVVVRLVGKRVTRRSPPDQFLSVCIEQVDNEGTDLVVLHCCGCVSESATPPPAAAEPVVEGV